MQCENCGGTVSEIDGSCENCGDHRYPYVIERGRWYEDGTVEVSRCSSRYCIKANPGELFLCRNLSRILPVDKELMVVYCIPVFHQEVEH